MRSKLVIHKFIEKLIKFFDHYIWQYFVLKSTVTIHILLFLIVLHDEKIQRTHTQDISEDEKSVEEDDEYSESW